MDTFAPKVSILMPVYNGAKFLSEAIESLLNQTYENFELLLINDGSTDKTEDIIISYKDKRIKYISKSNTGVSNSLNVGLENSKGEYIARMDADDIAVKDRIEKQINKFKSNSNLILCSSCAFYIDEEGKSIGRSFSYSRDYSIKKMLKFGNILFHPTIMFKRNAVIECGGYNENLLSGGEDYELWKKLLSKGQFISINEPLLYYRISKQAVSTIYYHIRHEENILQIDKVYSQRINTVNSKLENQIIEKLPEMFRNFFSSIIIESKNLLTIIK